MMNTLKKIIDGKIPYSLYLAISSVYMGIVSYFSLFNTIKFLWLTLPLTLLFFFITKHICDGYYRDLKPDLLTDNKSVSKAKLFILIFTILLCGQVFYWLAYFPGGFNLDAFGQWDQIHGYMQWNNWHPVLTTFIYLLLTRICDSFAFCIAFQLVSFSVVAALLLTEIHNTVSYKALLIIAFIIAFNPAIALNNICMIKDVAFSVSIIMILLSEYKILDSKGAWLKKPVNCIIFAIEIIFSSLVRHNAVFFVIPCILSILFLYRKYFKKILIIGLVSIISVIGIEGPLYSALGVASHSNTVGEIVGVPMSIMANAYINDYDNTPDEVKEFLENIADFEQWKENYIIGEWDSCKWEFGGIYLFENTPVSEILNLTLKTIASCPETTFQSIKENTRVVWQIVGYADWDTYVYIEPNDHGIVENPFKPFTTAVSYIRQLSVSLIGSTLFWNIGLEMIIYIFLTGFAIKTNKPKCLMFIFPVIMYNLLTMCLLCGPSHRYFYFNSITILPLICIINKECRSD